MSLRSGITIVLSVVFIFLVGSSYFKDLKSSSSKSEATISESVKTESSLDSKDSLIKESGDKDISTLEQIKIFYKEHKLLFGIIVVSLLAIIAIAFTITYFNRI